MNICYYKSPIGTLQIEADEKGICRVSLPGAPPDGLPPEDIREHAVHTDSRRFLQQACTQLDEYFAGQRRDFQLPLSLHGTEFQQKVWAALQNIPYGETRSYSEIAEQAGSPRGCRAVGMANNRNPVMIIVPCHRVIGKNGALTGYAAGLDVKQALLQLEQDKVLGRLNA